MTTTATAYRGHLARTRSIATTSKTILSKSNPPKKGMLIRESLNPYTTDTGLWKVIRVSRKRQLLELGKCDESGTLLGPVLPNYAYHWVYDWHIVSQKRHWLRDRWDVVLTWLGVIVIAILFCKYVVYPGFVGVINWLLK